MTPIEAIAAHHAGEHAAQPCKVGEFQCDVQTLLALTDGLRGAATGFLIAVDNFTIETMLEAEDGAEVPESQDRLEAAADVFREELEALDAHR